MISYVFKSLSTGCGEVMVKFTGGHHKYSLERLDVLCCASYKTT